MQRALDETSRRRATQTRYNEEHGTTPVTIKKMVRETVRSYDAVEDVASQYSAETMEKIGKDGMPIRVEDIPILISALEKDMKDLAKSMEFEKAAKVRDEIHSLREMAGIAGSAQRDIGREKRKGPKRFGRGR
jgi:excinuclease ABC subunit B